jgi:flagellar basal body-associated protein FliL
MFMPGFAILILVGLVVLMVAFVGLVVWLVQRSSRTS